MTQRHLAGAVVVITGASSGIGRATALTCAREGARLVLAARRGEALEGLVDECKLAGGEARARELDVADPSSAGALALAAVETFGRIDAWINNASVYAVGSFERTPPELFDRVLAVNLNGVIYGSRAAVAQFRDQGHGVLINVSSMIGGLAGPMVSAYATSKWGVRGFSFALREELRDAPEIHVCVVRPAAIDTPIFRHAANYSGRALRALTPTYPVEQAAQAIAALVRRPRREVIVGGSGRALSAGHALAPGLVDRIFGARATRNHFVEGEGAADTDGNVFEPSPGWKRTSGDWPTTERRRPLGLLAPLLGAAAALVVVRRRA